MGTDPKYTTVRAGERLDNLAYRLLGSSTKIQQVLDANPDLDIWNPRPGQLIKVPDAT
jgi:phage tail protein X